MEPITKRFRKESPVLFRMPRLSMAFAFYPRPGHDGNCSGGIITKIKYLNVALSVAKSIYILGLITRIASGYQSRYSHKRGSSDERISTANVRLTGVASYVIGDI